MIVDPLQQYGDVAVQVASGEELAAYLDAAQGRWKVAFHNDHLNEDFPLLCDAVYALRDCLLVVEEADWFCAPTWIDPEFERVIKYGRNQGLSLIAVSRRPTNEMHPLIRSQSWQLYCFSIDEPADADYLRRKVGYEFAEAVSQLPPLECYRVNLLDRREPAMRLRVDPAKLTIAELQPLALEELAVEDDEPEPAEA